MFDVRAISRSSFARNAAIMIMGTGFAQLIMLASSPLLTRIYGPEQYGTFALFQSITGVLAAVATGKYELAINITENDRDAAAVLSLSVRIAIVVSIVAMIVVLLGGPWIARISGSPSLQASLPAAPLAALFSASFGAYGYWFNRRKDFRPIARARVVTSAGVAGGAIVLGLLGMDAMGLPVGFVLGQALGFAFVFWAARGQEESILRGHGWPALRRLAGRYRKFPRYLMAGAVLNALSAQLYVFMIGSFFGVAALGAISLSQSVVMLPTSLIAVAVSEVFRQRAFESLESTGTCRPQLLRTVGHLAALSVIPFGILVIWAPELFVLVFGPQWVEAGVYAQILSPYYMIRFILAPVSGVVIQISEKLNVEIAWQIGLLAANVLSVSIGKHWLGHVGGTLALFSIANAAMVGVAFSLAYRYSNRRAIAPSPG